MHRDPRAYLWDAREAALRVAEFTEGASEERYLGDALLRSAVERQLEIVGEALGQLEKHFPGVAESIPDLRAAVNLRNILIHGYAKLNHRIVWRTVHEDLPRMAGELSRLLENWEG
ncbi:Uncharacterized conserved protein, contains HEPN domain [Thiohalospira halophila DSM 15071]|uniref:Uncharacterized conserved protein, contains HEPN domain n=1 Tax=Thiohalospira halophila DSM 15071 TaxID=1123397 RepID=A0A1I1NNR2_9GAMM|nr:HepT-like ribonuclease domain-containing protein [Thiohalospira halophila]SFC97118.1 Uncharacterized conserved protein, contains HEPN domain [Thiohalospira halophila DSM 15071]